MGRTTTTRERIGDMLVSLGLISQAQLDEALASKSSSRVGKRLVELGHVTETRLVQTLANQLSVPWVSLERIDFSAALLARIPAELADKHSIMPVYVRGGRGQPETLYVAMDDPTDEVAINDVARAARVRVRPMIAAPSDIRRAIEARYFGAPTAQHAIPGAGRVTADSPHPARGSLPGGAPEPARAPVQKSEAVRPPARVPPPPPGKSPLRADGTVAVDKYATPSSPPEPARTLTFLDGTQLRLPSAGKRSPGQLPVNKVRHVVKAVSQAAQGSEPAELRWEELVQAVLDAARNRGVVLSRHEVGEAWSTLRGRGAGASDDVGPRGNSPSIASDDR
jgi:type IV pilus assembly protein PilB